MLNDLSCHFAASLICASLLSPGNLSSAELTPSMGGPIMPIKGGLARSPGGDTAASGAVLFPLPTLRLVAGVTAGTVGLASVGLALLLV